MRYAWLRRQQDDQRAPSMTGAERAVHIGYNFVWWIPIILTILGVTSYSTGFVGFVAMTILRAGLNFYRNNVLTDEAAQRFIYRQP